MLSRILALAQLGLVAACGMQPAPAGAPGPRGTAREAAADPRLWLSALVALNDAYGGPRADEYIHLTLAGVGDRDLGSTIRQMASRSGLRILPDTGCIPAADDDMFHCGTSGVRYVVFYLTEVTRTDSGMVVQGDITPADRRQPTSWCRTGHGRLTLRRGAGGWDVVGAEYFDVCY